MKQMRSSARDLFGIVVVACLAASAQAADKTRVLLVVGGHKFDTNEFYQVFKDNPQITVQITEHPDAQAFFKAEAAKSFDVVVSYDFYQKIGDEAKADFVNLLKQGKGFVCLHHSLASYGDWPEYEKIVGGKYFLKQKGNTNAPVSTWKHDVDFKVQIADKQHPITRGVPDFQIHDETYGKYRVHPDVHVLLKTDEPTSQDIIGWCKTYGQARVVYLALGHDRVAYANPNYLKLLFQAIAWTARKE
jgi:uncharacterized protein